MHVHGGSASTPITLCTGTSLAAKQTEFAIGSATGQLLVIGRELADTPA